MSVYDMGIIPAGYRVHYDPDAGTVRVVGDTTERTADFAVAWDDNASLDANIEFNRRRYLTVVEDLATEMMIEEEEEEE